MDSADAAHNDAEGDRRERSFPSGQSRLGIGHSSDHASGLAMGALDVWELRVFLGTDSVSNK
jgi:hypothetical protein